jgi:hypothetical protein
LCGAALSKRFTDSEFRQLCGLNGGFHGEPRGFYRTKYAPEAACRSGRSESHNEVELEISAGERQQNDGAGVKQTRIMSTDKVAPVLARLEVGFRTDLAQLEQLEGELKKALRHARNFTGFNGVLDQRNMVWEKQWDKVEGILARTMVLVEAMEEAVESGEEDRLHEALRAWEGIQFEDAMLLESLGVLQGQAVLLKGEGRVEWNSLAHQLEAYFEAIHARAKVLRIKLELLKEHSREDVERILCEVFAGWPSHTTEEEFGAETYEREYIKAESQLESERGKLLVGFDDFMKALFMWVETPGERVRRNLSTDTRPD